MAQTATVDLKEIAQGSVLGVKLTNARQFRWRVKIAAFLITLGARIMWAGVEWEEIGWTSEKPTEPGFYWVRNDGFTNGQVVRVWRSASQVNAAHIGGLDPVATLPWEWWGPLEMPASPESETDNGSE